MELVGLGEPGVGWLNAALGAGAVLASAAAALLVGTKRLAAWFGLGAVLWGAPLVVIGLVPSVASAIVMLAIVGAGNALIDVGGFTIIGRIAPPAVLARVFGLVESIAAIAVGLGALLTPLVIDALDLRTALVVLGLLTPVAVGLSWRRLRALDAVIVGRDDELALLRGVPLLDALPLPALETRRPRARPRARSGRRGRLPPGRPGRPVLRRGRGDRAGRRATVGSSPTSAPATPSARSRCCVGSRARRPSRRSTSCAWSRCAVTASWP